jgi:hypothetical protein
MLNIYILFLLFIIINFITHDKILITICNVYARRGVGVFTEPGGDREGN